MDCGRLRRLIYIPIVLGLLVAESGDASAIARARPIDILCLQSKVFFAEVLSAHLIDCRLQHPDALACGPKDVLNLALKIDEILAVNDPELSQLQFKAVQSGDTLDVVIDLYNQLPRHIGGIEVPPPEDENWQA